jgi:hypothetical protein
MMGNRSVVDNARVSACTAPEMICKKRESKID